MVAPKKSGIGAPLSRLSLVAAIIRGPLLPQ
jgi:hypothetical protein